MRYFTWKLDWSSGQGTNPSSINSETIRLEPAFSTGLITDPASTIYGYLLKGEVDLAVLTPWQFVETTLETMLTAAQAVEPLAVVVDGLISFPPIPLIEEEVVND